MIAAASIDKISFIRFLRAILPRFAAHRRNFKADTLIP
jgi:hypothetical protein